MMGEKELSDLRKAYYSLGEKYRGAGLDRYPIVVERAELLKGLLETIESTVERDKSLWNPDISTKIRLAKKGMRLSKKIIYFERDIVKEYEKGNLSQDFGNRFISVTNLIKDSKFPEADREFRYFQEIMDLSKEYGRLKAEMERADRDLEKEQHRLQVLLDELSSLDKQEIDMDLVRKHEKLLQAIEEIKGIRDRYLTTIASKPISRLLDILEALRFPGLPAKDDMKEIRAFLSDYPAIAAYDAHGITQTCGFSEKKLSHICQETSRFKKTIWAHRRFFDILVDLAHSDLLSLDTDEGLDRLADSIEGVADTVRRIRTLRQDEQESKREYLKRNELEKRRGELSVYSKEILENDLAEAKKLQEYLRTPPENKESKGLISRIRSFFR